MSTIELKQILISHIRTIEDESLLQKIKQIIFEDPDRSFVYVLSDYEKDLLRESESDINLGQVKDSDAIFKELDEWLKEEE